MNKNNALPLISMLIAAIVSAYSWIRDEHIIFALSLVLIALNVVILYVLRRTDMNCSLSLLCSFLLLIFSVIVIEFTSEPATTSGMWAHISGAAYWAISFPLAVLTLEIIAVTSDSKLNYVLIGGFLPFISCAIMTITMFAVSYLSMKEIDEGILNSLDLLPVLFVNLVMSAFAAVILIIFLKKRKFILSRETCGDGQ